MTVYKKKSVARYAKTLEKEFESNRSVVFLCGPTYSDPPTLGAQVRRTLEKSIASAGFEVVLGEDDGLLALQARYGKYAHQNEMHFVLDQAAAIVLVAGSPGGFCELGMFADRLPEMKDVAHDFILVVEEKYRPAPSYLNLGPARVVQDLRLLVYADFANFDPTEIVARLIRRRTLYRIDSRGRPHKAP